MGRNVLVLSATLLLPFLGGGLIGYNIGHSRAEGTVAAEPVAALFSESVPAADRQGDEDSTGDRVEESRRNAITRTVAAVSPAVVGINVIEMRTYRRWNPWGDDPFFRQFFGDQTYVEKIPSLGSGFIISSDGYILTNDHVAGNAKEITVTLTSGEKYKAEVIGTDLVSDIALLKIEGKDLPHVRLGNSDDVIIGEWSIAFGNPFGLFDISDKPTVTVGVVSAVNMNLRGQEGRVYRGMIQTDAAINAGNSGGPLVNSLGEVIGVNAVIYTPNQGSIGLGFAIPINRVKGIVAELRKSGKIEREFWTGLEIQVVDQRIARYFGLEKAEGVIVSDVRRGSPADRAGFVVSDIILSVDGERITDDQTMVSIINDHKVGDRLAVRVMREKKMLNLSLQLEKRPAQGDR
jgi:serine protease Do